MPYIAAHISRALDAQQKDDLKTALGQAITVIPGKSEKGLMVEIMDSCDLYFGGEKRDCAYLDVKTYQTAELSDQKAFCEAVFKIMEQMGFHKKDIYMTIVGLPNWGVNGTLI